MKIVSAKVCIPAVIVLLAGCNKSENRAADSAAAASDTAVVMQNAAQPQDTVEASDDVVQADSVEVAQMAMLQALLEINGGEDADKLRESCTPNALKQLNDDYEYDDYDDSSIACWAINGRPNSDVEVVLKSLSKVAPDTYLAKFEFVSDERVEGTSLMQYKLAQANGEWKIDSYKCISSD